ncbi:hypothetical protein FJY94_06275 [Candidatus Kaiserbacteria bacterium]|nr:hypothetical protein [Candidatus Kaiserbacteria bacterium]
MKIFNLAIATPNIGLVVSEYALCLSQMLLALQKHRVRGYDATGAIVMSKQTSILPKSRQELVRDAIAAKCSHLLFIDSDQVFPASTAHRLAMHGKPVVGCNIATKCLPSSPTARNRGADWYAGDVVYSTGKSGVEQVWRLGCGVMLIDLSIFATLPKPWFNMEYRAEYDDFVGEDWYFCEVLERAGIPIFVDHELSREVGHKGSYIFEHSDIPMPQSAALKVVQNER